MAFDVLDVPLAAKAALAAETQDHLKHRMSINALKVQQPCVYGTRLRNTLMVWFWLARQLHCSW
jgi:hypothetical protein